MADKCALTDGGSVGAFSVVLLDRWGSALLQPTCIFLQALPKSLGATSTWRRLTSMRS